MARIIKKPNKRLSLVGFFTFKIRIIFLSVTPLTFQLIYAVAYA